MVCLVVVKKKLSKHRFTFKMSGSTGFYWHLVRALRLPFLSSTQVTGALESKGVFRVIRRERMILWRTAHFLTNCQKVKTFGRSLTYLKDCFWLAGKTIGIVTWQCPCPWKARLSRLHDPVQKSQIMTKIKQKLQIGHSRATLLIIILSWY